jgi:hypothetical protein
MKTRMPVRDALYKAGEELASEYRNRAIPVREIAERTVQHSGCSWGSVIPSDHCYNLVNRSWFSRSDPFFMFEGEGEYRFVGRDYSYTGPITWRERGAEPCVVGESNAGKVRWTGDPRRAP